MKLPIFFENSVVPVLLSYFAPIQVGAISLGFAVFSRGKLSTTSRIHETIHYRQWLELGFIGFLVLYPTFWVWHLLRGMSGAEAYFQIPFEKEAYANQDDIGYLFRRKPYAWARKEGMASLHPPVS